MVPLSEVYNIIQFSGKHQPFFLTLTKMKNIKGNRKMHGAIASVSASASASNSNQQQREWCTYKNWENGQEKVKNKACKFPLFFASGKIVCALRAADLRMDHRSKGSCIDELTWFVLTTEASSPIGQRSNLPCRRTSEAKLHVRDDDKVRVENQRTLQTVKIKIEHLLFLTIDRLFNAWPPFCTFHLLCPTSACFCCVPQRAWASSKRHHSHPFVRDMVQCRNQYWESRRNTYTTSKTSEKSPCEFVCVCRRRAQQHVKCEYRNNIRDESSMAHLNCTCLAHLRFSIKCWSISFFVYFG